MKVRSVAKKLKMHFASPCNASLCERRELHVITFDVAALVLTLMSIFGIPLKSVLGAAWASEDHLRTRINRRPSGSLVCTMRTMFPDPADYWSTADMTIGRFLQESEFNVNIKVPKSSLV